MINLKSLDEFKQDSINEGFLGSLLSFIPGTNAKKIKQIADKIIKVRSEILKLEYQNKNPKKIEALELQADIMEEQIDKLSEFSGDATQKYADLIKLNIKLTIAKEKEKWADKEEIRDLKRDQQELQKQFKIVQDTDTDEYLDNRPDFMDEEN